MKKLFFVSVLAIIFLGSCENDCIEGTGSPIDRDYSATAVKSVSLSGPFDLEFEQSDTISLRISAQAEILDAIRVETSGSDLEVSLRNKINCLELDAPAIIYLTGPSLEVLDLSGSGDIRLDNLNLTDLDIRISGSYDLRGSGVVDDVDIRVSGSADFFFYPLVAQDMEVKVSGSLDAEVSVVNQLDIDISGSADIDYKGTPTVSQRVSGSLDLRKRD